MKSRLCLILLALAVAFAGCRNPRGQDKMERELRFQEDRIYQLEDWCRQYHDLLDSCRTENTSLRTRGGTDSRVPTSTPVRVAPFEDTPRSGPKLPDIQIPQVEVPNIDSPPPKSGSAAPLPSPAHPVPKLPSFDRSSSDRLRSTIDEKLAAATNEGTDDDGSVVQGASAKEADGQDVRLVSFEGGPTANTDVKSITLNRLFTAGLTRSKRNGDDGVMVLVEPRNSRGGMVPPQGELSIAVIDPAATTEADARVARWDFSRAETAKLYRHTPLGDGVRLDLMWPGRRPSHSRLTLYARLVMLDGRTLTAQRTINVKLPPDAPQTQYAGAPTSAALAPEPVLAPEPQITSPSAAQQPDLFEVRPLQVPAVAAGPPNIGLRPQLNVPASTIVGVPGVTSPTPSIVMPLSPPAEEQVAIPGEPGVAATPGLSAQPPPATRTSDRRVEWAPYR